jgi:hypothetical protein
MATRLEAPLGELRESRLDVVPGGRWFLLRVTTSIIATVSAKIKKLAAPADDLRGRVPQGLLDGSPSNPRHRGGAGGGEGIGWGVTVVVSPLAAAANDAKVESG